MQQDTARPSRFPLVFEVLVWALYVGMYKYNAYMEDFTRTHKADNGFFPYFQLIPFVVVATVYIVPYYRWLLPLLLRQRRYTVLLMLLAVLYLWWSIKLNTTLAAGAFIPVAAPPVLTEFYQKLYQGGLGHPFRMGLGHSNINLLSLLLTDILAFSCVGFVRVAFEQEMRRRQIEKEHAALQLDQLKAQLQPHFLFNTLNSIYGLSLAGSPETPRFILLLSELMRYVLYDSGKERVALADEVLFMENYFELEQRKYEGASIRFEASGEGLAGQQVPPLLWLPLVENSFKHGRHHFSDDARVAATLTATPGKLHFIIENDMLPEPPPASPRRSGGIGLANIKRRLQLYYPSAHTLTLTEHAGRYRAELILHL
jgi:hypothetical protein